MIPRGLHLGERALFGVGMDLAYSLLVIALCLFIFFKTKEFAELSDHKGIKFFRNAFIYFGLGYLLRFFSALGFIHGFSLIIGRADFRFLILILFAYASSMAILSLLYSMVYKRLTFIKMNPHLLLHIIAVLLLIVVFVFGSPVTLFLTQLSLFVLAIIVLIFESIKLKRKNKLFTTYLLLFLFWILNIATLAVPRFAADLRLLLYAFSAALFIYITYKVVIRTHIGKNGKKKG